MLIETKNECKVVGFKELRVIEHMINMCIYIINAIVTLIKLIFFFFFGKFFF